MARNDFWRLAKNLDVFASSIAAFGPIRAAHRTVRELQQEGPSWTGTFSNSWQIKVPDGRSFSGDGLPGDPRPLPVPALTGRQAVRAGFAQDRAVFTISNFSPHAAEAFDLVEHDRTYYPEGWRISPTGPKTQQGKKNHDVAIEGRKKLSRRGDIGGGDPGLSSRTAPLDWYATFAKGGRLDRAVKIEMDDAIAEALRRFTK